MEKKGEFPVEIFNHLEFLPMKVAWGSWMVVNGLALLIVPFTNLPGAAEITITWGYGILCISIFILGCFLLYRYETTGGRKIRKIHAMLKRAGIV